MFANSAFGCYIPINNDELKLVYIYLDNSNDYLLKLLVYVHRLLFVKETELCMQFCKGLWYNVTVI